MLLPQPACAPGFLQVEFRPTITTDQEPEYRIDQPIAQRIIEPLPSIVYMFDLSRHTTLYSNRSLLAELGYGSSEIQPLGRGFVPQLLHPDDQPLAVAMEAALHNGQDQQVCDYIVRLRHRDGNWHRLRYHETVFQRHPQTGIVEQTIGQIDDTTARYTLDEHIRIQAELLNQIGDAVIATEMEFRITHWNAAAEQIYGWRANETIGQSFLSIIETHYSADSTEQAARRLFMVGSWSGWAADQALYAAKAAGRNRIVMADEPA